MRIAPPDLWKRIFSTFLIAVTTASSSAALADNKKTRIGKLGVSERPANFGIPFGQLLYKSATAAVYWLAAISVAENSRVEVSVAW